MKIAEKKDQALVDNKITPPEFEYQSFEVDVFGNSSMETNLKQRLTNSTDKLINATLENIIAQREDWEVKEYIGATKKLYAILTDCYEVFQSMNGIDNESKVCQLAFDRVSEARGMKFKINTHLIARIVQLVFGDDRRRVSNYAKALLIANENKIKTADLSDYLTIECGIEEVRRGKKKAIDDNSNSSGNKSAKMTTDEVGRAATYGAIIETLSGESILKRFDASAYRGSILLLATAEQDGTFAIRRLIQDAAVIKSAYSKLANTVSKGEMTKMLLDDENKKQSESLVA